VHLKGSKQAVTYTLRKIGAECRSSGKDMGHKDTVQLCAEAVEDDGGQFFVFDSEAKKCKRENTESASCTERWKKKSSQYDFYEIEKATKYVEGTIRDAEYPATTYATEAQAQDACKWQRTCKGYWQRVSGEYRILKAGSRTWSKGVPNHTVKSVKFKQAKQIP